MEKSEEKNSVSLEDLKLKMADFAKERDWDQFHSPRNLLLALVIYYTFATNIFKKKTHLYIIINPRNSYSCYYNFLGYSL